MKCIRRPLLLTAAALLAPIAGKGQNVVLDEGSFVVFRNDQPVGQETFTIRRQGIGADATLVANGVVRLDGPGGTVEMRPILQAGADRNLRFYQNRIEGADVSQVDLQAAGTHFVTTIHSASGERERELRARPGTILLDPDVAHQYYFLAARIDGPGDPIPVVMPRLGRQAVIEIVSVRPATLRMDREQVEARRVTIKIGDETRDVWFDDQGRVLRLEIPSAGYRAERDAG